MMEMRVRICLRICAYFTSLIMHVHHMLIVRRLAKLRNMQGLEMRLHLMKTGEFYSVAQTIPRYSVESGE
jgi:hypothetical protein